jgi:ribosomal protein S18 acetylase RimI-like enzyme
VSGYEPVEWVPLSEVRGLVAKGESVSGPTLIGLLLAGALKELYVAEAYRRAGVGRMLMDGVSAIAGRRGLSRVEWTTDTSNRNAQAFYEALGARPLASKIFYRQVR